MANRTRPIIMRLAVTEYEKELIERKMQQLGTKRIYDERSKLKKEARMIDTLKANVDDFLKPAIIQEYENIKNNQRE